jgi:hypothetical protein
MYRHGFQTVANGRVGQQALTQPVDGFIQRFEALDNCTSISAGQCSQCADSLGLPFVEQ